MITKYSIDLRQFHQGPSEKITFPTFEQCVMYGMYKLKNALDNKTSVVEAILIEDKQGRKIVITPTQEELGNVTIAIPPAKILLDHDSLDNTNRFSF